jgi:hypothetical protein
MSSEPTTVPADVAALDQALDRLRQPTTVHDRLAILHSSSNSGTARSGRKTA